MAVVGIFAIPAGAAPPAKVSALFDLGGMKEHVEDRLASARPSPSPWSRPGTWTFTRRPEVLRDVRLRKPAARLERLGGTAGNLLLRDRATGREFVHAGAIWTDGAGLVTRVEARLEGTELVVTVPAALLAASTYPAVLDPGIESAFTVTPPVTAVQAAVFDGTNYLIAWGSSGGLYALRVTPDGVPIDPDGLLVASVQNAPGDVAVTFNGSHYLVAWTEMRMKTIEEPFVDGDLGGVLYWNVWRRHSFAARIDGNGQALDPDGILVSNTEHCSVPDIFPYCEYPYGSVAVAHDGENFLVVAQDIDDTIVARLAPSGALLDATPIIIPILLNPAVAFDGSSFLVVGLGGVGPMTGIRITRDGAVLEPGGFALSSDTGSPGGQALFPDESLRFMRPSVAFDGTTFLVAWFDKPGPYGAATGDVHARRVSSDGGFPDESSTLLMTGVSASAYLATVFDGHQFVVTTGQLGLRLAGDGTVLDDPPWAAPEFDAVASDGQGTILYMDASAGWFVRTWVPDTEPPVVSVPGTTWQAATSIEGAAVEFATSALDAVHGPVPTTCSHESSAVFPPGATEVVCTATDPEGNVGTASFSVWVTFDWSGVLAPLNADGTSASRVGSTIPVKFRLTGASAGITDLVATASLVPASGLTAPSARPGDRQFRYDPGAGQYVVTLGTRDLSAGAWELRIEMGDGVERSVQLSLIGR